MKPIGLAFKNYEVNPFTKRGSGELMLIHQCVNCGKISPNRVAGDDNKYQILSTLEESANLDDQVNRIRDLGINLITNKNKEDVLTSLFGIDYKKHIRE